MVHRKDCFCNEQFNVRACSVQGIYKTADVLAHDPTSLACKHVNVQSEIFPGHGGTCLILDSGRDTDVSIPG